MKIIEHYNSGFAKAFLNFMNSLSENGEWSYWGIVIFNHIFYSGGAPSDKLRAHERVHINQIFFRYPFSWIAYYPVYVWDVLSVAIKRKSLLEGYTMQPNENEAYRLQTDSRYAPYVYDKAFQKKIVKKYKEFVFMALLLIVLAII